MAGDTGNPLVSKGAWRVPRLPLVAGCVPDYEPCILGSREAQEAQQESCDIFTLSALEYYFTISVHCVVCRESGAERELLLIRCPRSVDCPSSASPYSSVASFSRPPIKAILGQRCVPFNDEGLPLAKH